MDKVIFFIDGSNLYKGIKSLGLSGWKLTTVDFYNFCGSFLDASKHKLIRIYYYDAAFKIQWNKERYIAQQQFHSSLNKQQNIELKLGRLQGNYPKNIHEKGIDSAISVDMIKFAYNNSFDIGILLSADGDYVPAVQLCKDMGKNIWNIIPSSLKAYHLQKACDLSFTFEAKRIDQYQL